MPSHRRPFTLRSLEGSGCPKALSRRGFCAGSLAAGGLAAVGLTACAGNPRISVGGFNDTSTEKGPAEDFATGSSDDLAASGPGDMGAKSDMAKTSSSCSGTVSGGAATAVVAGSPVYISANKIYVCRDSSGLYAMSSACTHQGCKLTPEATEFYCNCHGATFDLNGQNPTSPAHSALDHYSLCVNTSGDIEIDPSQVVDPSTRA